MPLANVVRRRPSTAPTSPPDHCLNDDGTIATTDKPGEHFLEWLATAHPEIDAHDATFGFLVDDWWDAHRANPSAAEVIAFYCDPAAHDASRSL